MIHRLGRVTSTQVAAEQLLALGRANVGDVVTAEEQTAGRGRHGRQWVSPCGGLYATWLLPCDDLLALRAGLAVREAVAERGADARLKWPNDILLRGKKLAGVRIDVRGETALVGVGVNVESAPAAGATALALEGVAATVDELLDAIGERLCRQLTSAEVLSSYRRSLDTLGRCVAILRGSGQAVRGVAVDIDGRGRLLVESGAACRTAVASGECVHLETLGQED
jgi:BirA family biotin operon repressor/biotin-[acetyl-CoA-carboxylase] ligase